MWDFNPSLFINAPEPEWIYFGPSASLSQHNIFEISFEYKKNTCFHFLPQLILQSGRGGTAAYPTCLEAKLGSCWFMAQSDATTIHT